MAERQVVVNVLEDDLAEALKEKEQESRILLQIKGDEASKEIVEKIRKCVDKLLSEKHSSEDLQEYALQLGTMWGYMVAKEYGWQWKHIDFGGGVAGIYLVSPKEYYCCPPLYFLNKILQGNNAGLDGRNDNTVMLLFNMLEGIECQKPSSNYQVIS